MLPRLLIETRSINQLISIPARVNAALTQRLLQRGPEEEEVGCSSGHDGPFCDVDDHSGLELE
jgi:hypothetical protein